MMKSFKLLLASASIAAIASAGTAFAGTATQNISVTATVNASCTIDNVAPVSFGTYDPTLATPTTAAGSITVSCVKGTHPTVALGNGLNPDVNGVRAMKHSTAADVLSYQLFKPTGIICTGQETDVWGATGQAVLDPGVSASSAAVTYGVCGKLDAQQNVSAGTYSDTVIATVSF